MPLKVGSVIQSRFGRTRRYVKWIFDDGIVLLSTLDDRKSYSLLESDVLANWKVIS